MKKILEKYLKKDDDKYVDNRKEDEKKLKKY